MAYVGDECEGCRAQLWRPPAGPIPVLCDLCRGLLCDLCQRRPASGALCSWCADAVTLAEIESGQPLRVYLSAEDDDPPVGWRELSLEILGAFVVVVVLVVVAWLVIP